MQLIATTDGGRLLITVDSLLTHTNRDGPGGIWITVMVLSFRALANRVSNDHNIPMMELIVHRTGTGTGRED